MHVFIVIFMRDQRLVRIVLIIRHAACPGVRHSQNVQPFTGLMVIAIAAAEGVS